MSWMISNALMKVYENSHCSQAQEGGSWAGSSLDGAPSVQSNETHTPLAYLCSDRMTAFSTRSLSGMTFAHLTADRGEDLLTWYREGFLARTSALPAKAQDSTEKGPDFGPKWPASLARLDHVSSSLRTHQCSLFGEGYELLQTLPAWGMAHGGELWGVTQPVTVRTVSACGYSLMRPIASDGLRHKFRVSSLIRKGHQDGNLSEQFARLYQKKITPRSCETLMGWPLQWTSLKPLAMDRWQQWLNSHGEL